MLSPRGDYEVPGLSALTRGSCCQDAAPDSRPGQEAPQRKFATFPQRVGCVTRGGRRSALGGSSVLRSTSGLDPALLEVPSWPVGCDLRPALWVRASGPTVKDPRQEVQRVAQCGNSLEASVFEGVGVRCVD